MQVIVLRTNGAREDFEIPRHHALQRIHELIGCDTTDTVNLRDGRVMLVDDNGWETKTITHAPGRFELKPVKARKPVNPDATEMYHAVCRPGTTHQIVGDVAIVKDADFA